MRKLIILTAIVLCNFAVPAQQNIYTNQWDEIDSLIVLKNLPKSALQKVNIIYADAKAKHLQDEVIKALLYTLSLEQKTEEDDINKVVAFLQNELQNTNDAVSKAILSALLANNINDYYTQNFWKNQQRKETDFKEADIATWSNNQLVQTVDSLYAAALSSKKILQQTNTSVINAILIKGNIPGIRPTVFDLLAHDALAYYKLDLNYITQPAYIFRLTDEHVLASAADFMQYDFVTTDTASHILKAMQLYQQLLQFHVADADPSAFIDVNLERIEWVYNRAYPDNKEALYKNALLDITNSFTNTKSAAEAWYALAKIEEDKAAMYHPLTDTTGRYGYAKAKQLIEERLKAMPDSCFGNDEMRSLLYDITKLELSTQAESVTVANAPFRLLVKYKNVDTLYARLLLQKDVDKAAIKKNYDEWKNFALLFPVKTFQQVLTQTNDYRQHAVEIKVDALPAGNYSILFSNSKDFNDEKDKLALQPITVSSLAYIRNGFDYFVVDRETGQPLQNVKVTVNVEGESTKNNEWNSKNFKNLYTDSVGHFMLPLNKADAGNYGDVNLTLQKGKDKLESNDYLYSYRYSYNNNDDIEDDDSTYEKDNSRAYFFTDRSIYRPGQTVFFKGIVLTKDRKTTQQKLYNSTDSIEVDLNDANGKTIDSMLVTLNEYGSFAGKFHLPQNVLTGEFSIETIDFYGEAAFNVEEYKRPTFYVEFDTLKGSYRLNDTITVSGYVKSYSGSNIDNARISYNIQRTANFPYPYLFWKEERPYSSETEIADSIINADANGMFTIRFAAMPDSSVDKQTEPLFNFDVELSVTDANGETRENSTNVKVGYKSMLVQASIPEIADVNNFKNIFITTKNNADENVPAKVDVTIKPLQTPAKPYRKRLWEQPDQFVMSREVFESYFPYDEYEAETDYREWKKQEAVVMDTFNTTNTSSYTLPKQLKQGWYCIEVSAKDKYGDTIKDVRYIQLYDMNVAGLPGPQTNFSKNISNSGAPGDKAQLLLGTSEPNVFAVEKISSNNTNAADSFQYIKLNDNKKQLEYTIRPTDRDKVGLYYAFIKHNRFYTGGMQVYVNNDVKNLNITYASFRNKTEPGSKETWTVQVNNNEGNKADVELLTSMYDASLDQFKKQQWIIPQLTTYSYVRNDWNSQDLYVHQSEQNGLEMPEIYTYKRYDEFAKSASNLWYLYQPSNKQISIVKTKVTFNNAPRNYLKVTGILRDQYGDPVPFATIAVRGSKIAVAANANGEFGIAIPPGTKTLAISAVAYESKEIMVHSGIINVILERTSASISDVVVTTALGVKRESKPIGYSTTINGQNITDTSFFKINIRGITSTSNLNDVLVIIDGIITDKKIDALDISTIDNVVVLKGSEATAIYGTKAANGAIVITTKEFALRNSKKKEEQPQVQVRKNFNETAFFYPQLHADSAGNYTFSFTMPEALTQWKWMSFAHTKQAAFGLREQSILTQKTLMVQPNLPRFLRQGDTIYITAKITNLGDSILTGKASLLLSDATDNQPLNNLFKLNITTENFIADAKKSTVVKFPVAIPRNFDHSITVKIIALSGNYSDGEEKILPVLSNRMLVTETLPLFMPGEGSKEFKFEKLISNKSLTLTNESLTIQYTPNPVWYVVQSLPYLMQFPYECAEQTFNRFYANALGAYILAQDPQIKNVLDKWKNDSTGLESDLETNTELKQIMLNETPWVTDAENETQQRKNIALLFDTLKMNNSMASVLQQLKQIQKSNGAFSWFGGGNDDRYITQYILTGIGRLKKLNAIPAAQQNVLDEIETKALSYADKEAANEYEALIKSKADLTKDQLTPLQIQYWYMRSFFGDENSKSISAEELVFYMKQAEQYWMKQSPYMQGMIAIAMNRLLPVMKPLSKFKNTQLDIIKSLKENAVVDAVKGMHWKNNTTGYYWYQSPLEAQSLLINAFEEITPGDGAINQMRQWLILNKQTNNWGTTKATADACYALLSANNINTQNLAVTIQAGDSVVSTVKEIQQSGSGYINHRFEGKDMQPAMGNISLAVSNPVAKSSNHPPSYGAVYWQYFEDMDKITSASSVLSISKKLFIEKNSDKGKILQTITDNDTLKVGDKIIVRLILKTDRDMEYVSLKDLRAASMEPVNVLSEYKWQDGLGYYESTKDAATNFFIDHLSKGTYVMEYPVYITHVGNFSAGIANVQCMYAPEFTAHSESINMHVEANEK